MIKLENICAGYDGKNVLHRISFCVSEGKNLSIIGPNGCGKTTLLRAMAGILPFQGEIYLDHENIRKMKRKKMAAKVAMLSQNNTMYFNYTVLETVLMGRYIHGKGGILGGISKEDREAAKNALETVGMLGEADREIDTLSGGQMQRVLLAKVIAQSPDIILLDEPTNHLDFSYQVELIQFLRKWSAKEGKTVIGVLHDINLAMLLSEEVLLLEEGRIRAMGSIQEVYGAEILSETYGMDVAGYMLKTLRKWEELYCS